MSRYQDPPLGHLRRVLPFELSMNGFVCQDRRQAMAKVFHFGNFSGL
jgi:hypothetical protein